MPGGQIPSADHADAASDFEAYLECTLEACVRACVTAAGLSPSLLQQPSLTAVEDEFAELSRGVGSEPVDALKAH